jgi:hypothetical protein
MTNTIRAERATIEFCDGLSVDGYRMPNGEFRVGITSASLIVGFAEDYLRKAFEPGSPRFKSLQGAGFSGQTEILTRVTKTGERQERTINLKDFQRFIRFADRKGNASAGALLDALVEMSLTDFFKDGFNEAPLTIEEKRSAFYAAYAKTINWLEEDKNDRSDLISWN